MFWVIAYLTIGIIIGTGFLWLLFFKTLDSSAYDKNVNDIRIMIGNIPQHLQIGISLILSIGLLILVITWLPLLTWFQIRRIIKNK